MGNNLIAYLHIFFFAFVSSEVMASTEIVFPKGCLADNIKQSCDTIAKIPNDKILVFADGTQMPACFLETSSPENDTAKTERRIKIQSKIVLRLLKYLPSYEVYAVFKTASEPSALNIYFKNDLEGQNLVDELIALKEEIKVPIQLKAQDTKPDFDFAKKTISKIIEDTPYRKTVDKAKHLQEIQNIKYNQPRSIRPLSCKPTLEAFYSNEEKPNSITFTSAITNFPPAARIHVMGHEFAHNFDPCDVAFQKNHPFKNLISCLRNDVGDFKGDIFQLSQCHPHTREAYCDFFGALVLEEWMKQPRASVKLPEKSPDRIFMPAGYEAAIFLLDKACSDMELQDDIANAHPNGERRLRDIVLKNPTIAKALDCKVDQNTYRCDLHKGTTGQGPSFYETVIKKVKNLK